MCRQECEECALRALEKDCAQLEPAVQLTDESARRVLEGIEAQLGPNAELRELFARAEHATAELERGALRQAFDEIAAAVACADWEYPGQVVRAVREQKHLLTVIRDALTFTAAPDAQMMADLRVALRLRSALELGRALAEAGFMTTPHVPFDDEPGEVGP